MSTLSDEAVLLLHKLEQLDPKQRRLVCAAANKGLEGAQSMPSAKPIPLSNVGPSPPTGHRGSSASIATSSSQPPTDSAGASLHPSPDVTAMQLTEGEVSSTRISAQLPFAPPQQPPFPPPSNSGEATLGRYGALSSIMGADLPSSLLHGAPPGGSGECRAFSWGPLPGSEVLDVCRKLQACGDWSTWPEDLARELALKLANHFIDGHGSPANVAGGRAFLELMPQWNLYLAHHPWVQTLVDPLFLAADVATGPGAPGALQAPQLPALYPPAGGLFPVPGAHGAGNYCWAFPATTLGMNQLHHFAGALQGVNVGLHLDAYLTGGHLCM